MLLSSFTFNECCHLRVWRHVSRRTLLGTYPIVGQEMGALRNLSGQGVATSRPSFCLLRLSLDLYTYTYRDFHRFNASETKVQVRT